jgi:hypothetical protein
MVFTVSFCRQPPFGARPFRYCLIFSMCWYAVMTVLAETLHLLVQPAAQEHLPNTIARVLTYFGVLSFVIFIRACVMLRRYEAASSR